MSRPSRAARRRKADGVQRAQQRQAFEARWYHNRVWRSGNLRRRPRGGNRRPVSPQPETLGLALLAACDDAFPELPPAWFDDFVGERLPVQFGRVPSHERLRRTAQQPLRCDLALVVPNLRVRHRTADSALVCTIDGRRIAQVADDAGPDEAAAFLGTIREALRARVEQFVAWTPPERTVWLLRQLGITVLLTGRQRSWIPSPTVWVVSRHAPFDQVNRLLLEVLAFEKQWWRTPEPGGGHGWRRFYQPDGTVWTRLDLMVFLVLGMPISSVVRKNLVVEDCYRELCRLVGFADRTTLLRRFARRVLDGPWVYDIQLDWFTQLRATLKTTSTDQVYASVATRTGGSEQTV
ncbi:MAG: hypothetical protein FWF02_13190 [Micrococcales bacterium]|nr:hypothetical protein [Micrococcales bacterium]